MILGFTSLSKNEWTLGQKKPNKQSLIFLPSILQSSDLFQTEAQVSTPAGSRENADTWIISPGKRKKKTLSMMRTSTLAWRESIYSFIMFIQQNKQRSGLCCSAERSASITVKFQIKALHSSHFDDHFKACPPPLPHQPPQRRPWLLTLSQATWSFIQTKSTNLLQCVQFEAQRNTRLVIFILNSRWRHSTCK